MSALRIVLLVPFLWFVDVARATEHERGRIPVLVVSGANNHDWEWTSPMLVGVLEKSGKFDVELTTKPEVFLADRERLARFRAIVLDYNGKRWGEAAEAAFLDAVRGGTGVVVVHAANNAFPGWTEYEELVGDLWRKGTGHGSFHAFDVKITDRDHPVTRDLPDLSAHPDELYHRLVRTAGTEHRVLATAFSDPETGGSGEPEPMILVASFGKGRVFHTPLGHVWRDQPNTHASHEDPQFQDLVVRGTEWAATGDVTPATGVGPNRLTDGERAAGWRLLFDGETPRGWRGYRKEAFPGKGWTIEDGALRVNAQGGGGDIVTVERFRDFELELEWKVSPGANSGIMYRVTEDHGAPWQTGPEYQILDDGAHDDGGNTSTSAGALYGMIAAEGKLLRPVGEWNLARIRIEKGHVEHWVNRMKVVEFDMNGGDWKRRIAASKFAQFEGFGLKPEGHLSLQDHGNDVWYRSIKVRELRAVQPREAGAPKTGETIELFNGRDLTGWTYHLNGEGSIDEVWSVEDGVLVCKGNPIGYLRTEADYTNYVLELDWRFDPETKNAGNSGVLLRMQLQDKVWPRSVEAQLQSGAAGDFWNIDQFPMRVAADRTSGRNTKRTHTNENPIGEWNHYRITVDGGLVILEVNGEELNRATDVAEWQGKICLQSEGAEIHFRDIRLTPIVD